MEGSHWLCSVQTSPLEYFTASWRSHWSTGPISWRKTAVFMGSFWSAEGKLLPLWALSDQMRQNIIWRKHTSWKHLDSLLLSTTDPPPWTLWRRYSGFLFYLIFFNISPTDCLLEFMMLPFTWPFGFWSFSFQWVEGSHHHYGSHHPHLGSFACFFYTTKNPKKSVERWSWVHEGDWLTPIKLGSVCS